MYSLGLKRLGLETFFFRAFRSRLVRLVSGHERLGLVRHATSRLHPWQKSNSQLHYML
jgi:hypothetical protein